jgi:anti-sigma regulatory factor (Ser/Thr protein kinase)
MSLKIALEVPEDAAYISMVRQMGRTLLEPYASEQIIDDIELVIGELCSNVTRHARSEKGCYRVEMEHRADRFIMLVADEGQGFAAPRFSPMGTLSLMEDGTERYGGFGLHLVDSLTDSLVIQDNQPRGTTVRVEKMV